MSPIISFKELNKKFSLNENLSPTPTEISADVDQLIKSLRSIGYGTQNSRENQVSQLQPNEVSKPTIVRTANLRPIPSGVVTGGVIPRDYEFEATSKSKRVKKGQPVSSYNLRPRARDKSRNGIDSTSDQRGHLAKAKAAVIKKKGAGKTASKRKKP